MNQNIPFPPKSIERSRVPPISKEKSISKARYLSQEVQPAVEKCIRGQQPNDKPGNGKLDQIVCENGPRVMVERLSQNRNEVLNGDHVHHQQADHESTELFHCVEFADRGRTFIFVLKAKLSRRRNQQSNIFFLIFVLFDFKTTNRWSSQEIRKVNDCKIGDNDFGSRRKLCSDVPFFPLDLVNNHRKRIEFHCKNGRCSCEQCGHDDCDASENDNGNGSKVDCSENRDRHKHSLVPRHHVARIVIPGKVNHKALHQNSQVPREGKAKVAHEAVEKRKVHQKAVFHVIADHQFKSCSDEEHNSQIQEPFERFSIAEKIGVFQSRLSRGWSLLVDLLFFFFFEYFFFDFFQVSAFKPMMFRSM